MRRGIRNALTIGVALCVCKAAVILADIAMEAWRQVYGGDALIFLSMGRAMLQGLTPYVDIFENKPPGIFLLSAAAEYIGHNLVLARIAEITALAGLPLLAILAARAPVLGEEARDRRWRMFLLGGFGVLLAALGARWSLGLYTESFAAFSGCAFVVALLYRHRAPRIMTIVAGAALALSGLFKEPAVIACIGAALLLTPSLRALLRTIVLPVLVAVPIGLAMLFLSGTLTAYVTVELPYILFWHSKLASYMALNDTQSLWMGGMRIDRVILQFWHANIWLTMAIASIVALAIRTIVLEERREKRLWQATCFLLAMFLGVMAGQAGGDSGHRLVTTFPVLFALALRACAALPTRTAFVRRIGYPVLATPIVVGILLAPVGLSPRPAPPVDAIQMADTMDALLDACGLDRYLLLSAMPEQIYGYTRHTPLPSGPLSISLAQRLSVPLFRTMLIESLDQADIVVQSKHESVSHEVLRPLLSAFLEQVFDDFQPTPWPCAEPFMFPDHLYVLYRQQ